MNIKEIARKIALIPSAILSVFWKGWKITYGILCVPKKLLDLAIKRFSTQPLTVPSSPNEPPVISLEIPKPRSSSIVRSDTSSSQPGFVPAEGPLCIETDSPSFSSVSSISPILDSPGKERHMFPLSSLAEEPLVEEPPVVVEPKTETKKTFSIYKSIFG